MFAAVSVAIYLLGSESDAIARHNESLGKITSYHMKVEFYSSEDEATLGYPLVLQQTLEVLRDGPKYRSLDRVLVLLNGEGKSAVGPHGDVLDYSADGSECRVMSGWDPEHPLVLPMEMGRGAVEFSSVSCQMRTQDPTIPLGERESGFLLWQLAPGWSLARISDACEIVEISQADAEVTRLKIVSISSPENVALLPKSLVGRSIDLDHRHGSQISRWESAVGTALRGVVNVVCTVKEFREGSPGLWYPAETITTVDGFETARTTVTECYFNQSLDEKLLVTQFPEGAKVVSGPDLSTIHIWGQGKPEATFTSLEDYAKYIGERTRKFHAGGQIASTPPREGSGKMFWVIVVNVVLIGLILFFTIVRRRLSRPSDRSRDGKIV